MSGGQFISENKRVVKSKKFLSGKLLILTFERFQQKVMKWKDLIGLKC